MAIDKTAVGRILDSAQAKGRAIPAYAYSTKIPVTVRSAKHQSARAAGLIQS